MSLGPLVPRLRRAAASCSFIALALALPVGCAEPEIVSTSWEDVDRSPVSGVCESGRLELPVVTHYSAATRGFEYLASDAPSLFAPTGVPDPRGSCNYVYADEFLPDVDHYPAAVHTDRAVSDDTATEMFLSACQETGVAFDLLRPDAFDSRASGPGRLQSKSGRVQVLHAKIIDGSLATIMLPPNWDRDAAPGTYPIVFNGFYDLNQNVFAAAGPRWAETVALSGIEGRTGAIGVLWNGGGALASRTINPAAFRQFDSVVQWVDENVGGDRHRIFMTGGSRGGLTTVAMASNPFDYDYTVKFAAPTATPTRLGEHASLMSTTYPPLLYAATWSTGLADAWRPDWTYPTCAGRPEMTGMTGPVAHAHVLTGADDLDEANAELSPISPIFIEGLRRAGTEIYLVATEKDDIVPYSNHVAYGLRLLEQGLPVHADVLIRAGHTEHWADGATGHHPVRFNKMIEALFPDVGVEPAPPHEVGLDFYRLDRATGGFDSFVPSDGQFPFSMDAPAVTARGDRFPMVFVGQPDTAFRVGFVDAAGTEVFFFEGAIEAGMTATQWIEVPAEFPLGSYRYTLQITKPGMAPQLISDRATVTGDIATVDVEAELPMVTGAEAARWARAPWLPSGNTTWGLSEY